MPFIQDRSNEFKAMLRSQHSRQQQQLTLKVDERNLNKPDSYFKTSTNVLATAIYNTQLKLETLKDLCKNKSLITDNTNEVQNLVVIIKQDVDLMKQQISRLNDMHKQGDLSCSSEQHRNHCTVVILSLESYLAGLSKEFKTALENRAQNMKEMQKRIDVLSNRKSAGNGFHESNYSQTNSTSKYQPNTIQNQNKVASEDVVLNFPPLNTLFSDNLQQQQLQLQPQQSNQQTNVTYLTERVDSMRNIESTIVELGDIFQQLSSYVHEQEEQIQLIDSNLEHAELQVDAAHIELLKYFKNISSNRWLIIKVFAILILFFIMFTLIS